MGICSSVGGGKIPQTGELRRISDALEGLGAKKNSVRDALRIFCEADKDGSGSINISEFASMFKLRASNVFLPRLLALFDVGGDGEIGALEFVLCLAQFFTHSQRAHIYFAWRLFDQDDSGSMDTEEFSNILANTLNYVGRSANTDAMNDRVVMSGRNGTQVKVKGFKTLIKEADIDENGVITIDEFKVLAANSAHLVAPAFELWTALEDYSHPCYLLKQEIIKAGNGKQLYAMLHPKAAKALGEKSNAQPAAASRMPGSASQSRANPPKTAPKGADSADARHRRAPPSGTAPEVAPDRGDGASGSSRDKHQHRSHHASDDGERAHRSHHRSRESDQGSGDKDRDRKHRSDEGSRGEPSSRSGGGGGGGGSSRDRAHRHRM